MNPSGLALAGYATWTLLLLGLIAALRGSLTLSGEREPNSFDVDGADVSPFSNRLCRAHANCCENLPVFASLVLLALVTGNAAITDPLALWVLIARVGQSTTHLISTANIAVLMRFGFFLVQLLIQVWWAIQLFGVFRA